MTKLTTRLHTLFKQAYEKLRNGQLKTFIPFLGLFRLNGKPMTLKMHYMFAPLFNVLQPLHTVVMCGRQLGKSTNISASMGLRNMLIPYYHTVLVQPRADQIQRMMNTIYKPLIASCPIRDVFISSTELGKLSLREFKNGSLCYAEFAYTNADRLRGLTNCAQTIWDESQDIEYEFLNIGNETMSASLYWGFAYYTGTPKTTDTTLALLWDRSSKAEWVIKCLHCGYFNIPNPDHDLLKMIGNQGPICAKCGKPVYPYNGGYVHAEPEKALTFPGYHISQTIHPLHTSIPSKWQRLLTKVNDYRELELYNEVFGWPYDASVSPLTLSDMKRAIYTPTTDTGEKVEVKAPSDIERIIRQYRYITVGVDWSGGGMVSDSYTAFAVLGLRGDSDVIDVLYGKRLPKGMSPTEEADEIMTWIRGVGADAFAYDNGGAGFTRLEIMNHAGLRNVRNLTVVPINYVRPHSGDVMQPHTGQREADLYYYTLDKSRSLAITLMAIKSCRIRFPEFSPEDAKAYQLDFLALREDPRKSLGNETVILITKKSGVPDDFAHAVNFGCSQIWDHFGAYPRIGSRYDASILDYDENNHKILADNVFGPRGDFERFMAALDARAAVVGPDSLFD